MTNYENRLASSEEIPTLIDRTMESAAEAFRSRCLMDGNVRQRLLLDVARRLDARSRDIVSTAEKETNLSSERLESELKRTTDQLRFFARLAAEGSWVDARIDLGPPDIRRVLAPLGPVVVFGASNFPLAFSTPGGDTASALAVGCPVVVKGHPAHPKTSDLVALAFDATLASLEIPKGSFQLVQGSVEVAEYLVDHPATSAVGFTGSLKAGRSLFDRAAARESPIPVYAEMGSVNPVFVLPRALESCSREIAAGLVDSATLGVGQFCTKPGVVVGVGIEDLATEVSSLMAARSMGTMLTPLLGDEFATGVARLEALAGVELLAGGAEPGTATCLLTEASTFMAEPMLRQEVFGPMTLLVSCTNSDQLLRVAASLEGQLTGTIHAEPGDDDLRDALSEVLAQRVGRLVYNGYPTGVKVSHAIQHGGPYPATTDSRSTSVGSAAILRFVRPICYQNAPQEALPPELMDANPTGIVRLVDGKLTREPISA